MTKTILITGGSGFLGRSLAKSLQPEYKVFLGSRNNKQNLKSKQETGAEVLPLDVSNIESVRDAFRLSKPDIVIHAAATKFVDLSEKFPMEAVDVNITGSQNIARVAMESGTKFVLGISTDKAAPPIRNIYGLSKATMERMFCLSNNTANTKFACVRYGNVAWSTGSVFPIWKEMHDTTRIISSTGPEMRRFFFTVEDAVNLVKTALLNQDLVQGKILSRAMKSAQISDILNVWIENFGGAWAPADIRPGEREDEVLVGDSELEFCETLEVEGIKHFLISPNTKSESPLTKVFTSQNAERLTPEEILKLITSEPEN
jgi:UDP-glucose 4-epimerase